MSLLLLTVTLRGGGGGGGGWGGGSNKHCFLPLFHCTYSRPRYQVSVYRTIGPLVSCSTQLSTKFKLLIDSEEAKLNGNIRVKIIKASHLSC